MCFCCCNDKEITEEKIIASKETKELPSNEEQRKNWKNLLGELEKNENLISHLNLISNFVSLSSQVEYLRKKKTEKIIEKVFLIFSWLKKSYEDKKLSFKLSCQVAGQFVQLCKEFNINSIVIKGFAKDDNFINGKRILENNHAWNAFEFDGIWYYVDVLWAATKQRSSNHANYWFMTPRYIFEETHYSDDFPQKNRLNFNEFIQMHVNQLEYHILGLKCKNFPFSIVHCHTKPFYIEFTSKESVNLHAFLKNSDIEQKNRVIVQKENLKEEYKYCVIFYLEKIQDKQTLVLKCNNLKADLTTYTVVLDEDHLPDDLPKYKLKFESDIELTSHQTLVLTSTLDFLNIEFSLPESITIEGTMKNLDNSREADLTMTAQTIRDDRKFVVFTCFPNFKIAMITFSYINKSQTLKEFVKFFVVKKNDEKEILRDLVKIDCRNDQFFVFSPLDYSLKINQNYKFRYFFKNAQSVKLCNSEGKFVELAKDGDIFENNYTVDKPGSLKVFVKKQHETTVFAWYVIGDFYSSKIDHIQSFNNILN